MKKIALRAASLTLVLTIAFGIGSSVALACDGVVPGDGFTCYLTGEDPNYCYYSCDCYVDIVRCANKLGLAGFEII